MENLEFNNSENENPLETERPQNYESELSTEQLEAVMSKVKDINQPGAGYSVVMDDFSKTDELLILESVLKDGLLGKSVSRDAETFDPATLKSYQPSPETWKKDSERRDAAVYMNITGRAHGSHLNPTDIPISESYWLNYPRNRVAVLFDIDSYKEETAHIGPKEELGRKRTRTFRVHANHEAEIEKRDDGTTMSDSEKGFMLTHRVPPRLFQGIIFNISKPKLTQEEIEARIAAEPEETDLRNFYKNFNDDPEDDPAKYEQRAREIADVMLRMYQDKPELLIPVYDTRGNLYWPKKMTADEIAKMPAHD